MKATRLEKNEGWRELQTQETLSLTREKKETKLKGISSAEHP